MRKLFCCLLSMSLFLTQEAQSQSQGVSFKRILQAATQDAQFYSIGKTADGGHITAGVAGTGGDVTLNNGQRGWIVKFNSQGGIDWQQKVGTGGASDELYYITQTSDGGYIACGQAQAIHGAFSAEDAFFVKLSSTGQVIWQKTFGSSAPDRAVKLLEATDGSFYGIGTLMAGDYDAPTGVGGRDVWFYRLSATGDVIMQKTIYGGDHEYADDIVLYPDGNYLISATGRQFRLSSPGQNIYAFGDYTMVDDAWVIKITPSGTVLSIKNYGTTNDEDGTYLAVNSDGSYYLVTDHRTSSSPAWKVKVIKIDAQGNQMWQRDLSWATDQYLYLDPSPGNIAATPDGGLLMAGSNNEAFVCRLDSAGNRIWQQNIGGSAFDNATALVVDPSNSIVTLVGHTRSSNGDMIRSGGGYAAFILKVGAFNTIKGTVYRDNNSNGVKDIGEPNFPNAIIQARKNGIDMLTSSSNGGFTLTTDTGQYVNTVINQPYYTAIPTSITTPNRTTYYNTDSIGFGLQPIPGINDLAVSIFSLDQARPGFQESLIVRAANVGTTSFTGKIRLVKDHRTYVESGIPNITTTNNDTLEWNVSNLPAFDSYSIRVNLRIAAPPVVGLGDTLINQASAISPATDASPVDNLAILKQIVIGSYDPNDKHESHGGRVTPSFLSSGERLQYTIRFQNTGTDTAFTVVVRDTLDSRLQWNTLEMVAASHTYKMNVANGNQITWTFDNIKLVDSVRNEPLSHGYIVFTLLPKTSIPLNDVISNRAAIYFDYNLPIFTNVATTKVQENTAVLPVNLTRFGGYLNGNASTLNWTVSGARNFDHFELERSVDGRRFTKVGELGLTNSSDYSYIDNIGNLSSSTFYYRLKMLDIDRQFTYSGIVMLKRSSIPKISIYPNPVGSRASVSFNAPSKGQALVEIVDGAGKKVASQTEHVEKGSNVFVLGNLQNLAGGTYILRVRLEDSYYEHTFVINSK